MLARGAAHFVQRALADAAGRRVDRALERRVVVAVGDQPQVGQRILDFGAFEEALRYARNRSAFGRPIGEFQGMRWKLAEMYRDIEVGRSMLYRACATANPFPDPYEAAVAKMYCNEMAIRVTNEAIQVHGGYGFTDEYPVSRFYRGARYGTLDGGTTETLKELVGKRLMTDFPDKDGFLAMGTF